MSRLKGIYKHCDSAYASSTVMSMDSQLDVACSGNRSPKAAVDNKHTHGTKDINILILGKRDVGKTGKDLF